MSTDHRIMLGFNDFINRNYQINVGLGGVMDFLSDLLGVFGGINFEAIVQLTMLAAIMIAGPVVIFLLAARGGDL